MASPYLGMFGVARLSRYQQREDYVHEMGGGDFILHGLFVDDMSTIPTSDHLKEEFMALYSADFDVTGEDLMQSFLGLEVEQQEGCIKLHLDTYIS